FHQRRVRIRPAVQQRLEHGVASIERSQRERRDAMAIGGLHVCSGANQKVYRCRVIHVGGPVEGRRTIRLGSIPLHSLLEQGPESCLILLLDGVDELHRGRRPNLGTGSFKRAHQHQHDQRSAEPLHNSSSIFPVLSPKLSRSTPTLSNSVRCRLAIAVRCANRMCRPPLSLPPPPPATSAGRFT